MTQKLTAAKARERIEHLQNWQAQRGLTLREEEYLQALELALELMELREDATLIVCGSCSGTGVAEEVGDDALGSGCGNCCGEGRVLL